MDLGVSLIKAIVTLFDYALYPFYMVIHRPWLVIKRRQKQRAWLSYLAKNRVLYKGVQVMMKFFKSSEDCESGGVVPNAQAPKMFGTTRANAFTTNTQSKFASIVLDGVLGPLRLAWYT